MGLSCLSLRFERIGAYREAVAQLWLLPGYPVCRKFSESPYADSQHATRFRGRSIQPGLKQPRLWAVPLRGRIGSHATMAPVKLPIRHEAR
jgi:hypothetical protein